MKTPITPPTAYTDFLKALTPIMASPPQSALQRSLSDDSVISKTSAVSNATTATSFSSTKSEPPRSATSNPPTPLERRNSGLKRLRIPQSPAYSPSTCGLTPRTGISLGSAVYSPFSPADWSLDSATRRYFETPRSAVTKPVSVRSVVTRTVTYKRAPSLDPAPKGKKRKIESTEMLPPPTTPSTTTPTVTA